MAMNKFKIEYDMGDRGLTTLFKHQYFTIDAKERKNWDYEHLNDYMGEYKIYISSNVENKFEKNESIGSALKDLSKSESKLEISNNKSERYAGKKQYIRCRISKYLSEILKKIFVSTLVYEKEKIEIPESEKIIFEFDTRKKMVEIVDIKVYEPIDNPYYKYARNAVGSLSVEAIGINQYSVESEKGIKDFYDRTRMSAWKERKNLEKESEIASKAGVYMLYDEKNNSFYVGKAIQLKERMIQHTKKPDDPIPNFTHYRYSVISPEYREFLYLIENAAIHDCAWLFDMPAAQKYTPSLVKKVKTANLSLCHIVNVVEHQTRKQ
jgi:hypothetical protein